MNGVRWSAGVASTVCVAGWTALVYAEFGPSRGEDGLPFVVYLLGIVPLGLGWLIAVRAPRSPVGAALAWLAAFMVATPAVEVWGETNATGTSRWGSEAMAVVAEGAWPWHLVGFLVLLLVFPDGLLPGWRWRVVVGLIPLSALVVNAGFVMTMNYHTPRPAVRSPVSVPEAVWLPVQLGALGLLLTVVVACGVSVVVRYRRGGDRVQAQVRWLLLAAIAVAALMVASWGVVALGWAGPGAHLGFLAGIVVLVPTAVAIAVLRHDLFEIDRLLSDSVAWLLTTVVAAGLLAGAVVVIGYAVGQDSLVGLTGAVFLVALAFLPLHRRVHRAVGRVLDRDRTVLLERIGRFVDGVRDGSAEPESVEEVLQSAIGDSDLRLQLIDLDGRGYVDVSGSLATPVNGEVRVPLRTADSEIGAVVLSGYVSMRRLRRAKLAASAAALPIEVSRLRLGLRRALNEVEQSRHRLLSATVTERQRIERNLHDGAQQRLVAVGMQLRAAQRLLAANHPASGEIDQAVIRLEDAITELRRLAHGIRPTGLDDGLPAALRRLGAECTIPVQFDVDDVSVPEVVATTVYFVVSEAMANALKHAKASQIRVNVREFGDAVHVSVVDNGVGGVAAEFGLTSLRDRVDSVSGRLTITSAPGRTAIEAVLPCAS